MNCLTNADHYGRRGLVVLRTPECIELSNPGGFRVDVKAAISRIGQYHYNRNIREQLAHPCGREWAGDGLTRIRQ